jgi:hypothetical protein
MKRTIFAAIILLAMTAGVTNSQVIVERKENKFIQIGAKLLGSINSPYAKVLGGALGFLFAEEKLPQYDELKASLQKQWMEDIDDKSKENYKTFINGRKKGYVNGLQAINTFDRVPGARDQALAEAGRLWTIVNTDIPLFHENEGGKPYSAGPTLPYLFSAMTLNLGLLKMQIDWVQEDIDQNAGDAKTIGASIGKRDALVSQYNANFISFWKTLQKEIKRAKVERLSLVTYHQEDNKEGGYRYFVYDKYDSRTDLQTFQKYYKHVEKELIYGDNSQQRMDNDMGAAQAESTNIFWDVWQKAMLQITKETNAYDLAPLGYYGTPRREDLKRGRLLYACSERLKNGGAELRLVCPFPDGGVDELGEMRAPVHTNGSDYLFKEFFKTYSSRISPRRGIAYPRTEDGSIGLTEDLLREPPMAEQSVTNTNDSGPGSLRQAVANGGNIDLTPIAGHTITLTSGPIHIYLNDVLFSMFNSEIDPMSFSRINLQPVFISSPGMTFVVSGDAAIQNGNTIKGVLVDRERNPLRCGKTMDGKRTFCPALIE